MKKRILYIHHTFRAQSYNAVLLDFARRVNKEKYDILVCCLREGGPYEKIFRDLGLKVKNFRMGTVFNLWVIFKIIKFIKENRIDIVHTAIFPADIYGRISAKLAGVPVIVSSVWRFEEHKQELGYLLFSILDTLTMRLTTQIIAISNATKRYIVQWHRVKPNKITVIYNYVDLKRFRFVIEKKDYKNVLSLHNDKIVVGTISRLVSVKGLFFFLEAVSMVLEESKQVQFLIVGDGPLKEKLKKKACDLGIRNFIVFTGFRQDIPDILGVVDIFVMSSLSEGLGIAALEAMSAGKPVVATKVGGIPEIVEDRKTGILVPPRDAKSLAEAILELLKSSKKREEMGKRGRQRALQGFSIERMVREYEKFYDTCTAM